MPLVPVNAASVAAAKIVTHGAIPIELSAGLYSIKSSVVATDVAVGTAPGTLSSADLALQDTGAVSAAEWSTSPCGHTPSLFQVWAPPLPQLDGASILCSCCCVVLVLLRASSSCGVCVTAALTAVVVKKKENSGAFT